MGHLSRITSPITFRRSSRLTACGINGSTTCDTRPRPCCWRSACALWQVSKILRHAGIAITCDTYGHLYPEPSRAAADRCPYVSLVIAIPAWRKIFDTYGHLYPETSRAAADAYGAFLGTDA